MSDFTDYAERVSERYGVLKHIGQPELQLKEAGVSFQARRGPGYAVGDLARADKALAGARGRARDDQIRTALDTRSYLDLLLSAPLGVGVSVSELVSREPRVVLLSKAGAGKSTALRSLAADRPSAAEGEPLVLLVSLAEFAASEQSLTEYLAADAEKGMSLALDATFFQSVLTSGQAIVCLDGLDEIPGQDARIKTVEQIQSLVEQFPRARYIVTARENAYEPTLARDSFVHYVLSPWSETVAADLERAWSEAAAEWTEEEAQEHLAAAPRLLRDILAARDVVALFEGGKLNAGWQEIRSHLWDVGWRERISLVFRFLSQEQPEAWGKAMALLLEAGTNDSFEPVLHRHLLTAAFLLAGSDVSDDLDQEVRRTVVDGLFGWLKDADAAGRQEAVAALFQLSNESYAAEQVLQAVRDGESSAWMREAAVLLAAKVHPADVSETIQALCARIDDAEEDTLVRQAASSALGCLGSIAVLGDEVQDEIGELLNDRVQDGEVPIDVRAALAESIHMVVLAKQDEGLVETLLALARGEGEVKVPYAVQMAAGRGLGALAQQTEDSAFVEQMWAIAHDVEIDESVRAVLAGILGRAGDAQEAAHILVEIAQNSKIYPPGRRDGLDALGELGYSDEAVVEALIAICQTTDRKTKDFERLAAARALGKIGNLDLSLQYLLMLIADKSIYRSTRNDALALLGEMGFSGDEALDSALVAVLQVWVTEENTTEDVREGAMASLAMLQAASEEVVRDLIGVVQDKRSYPRVRRAAVGTLAKLPIEQKDVVVESISVPFYDSEEKGDLLRVPIARLLYLWGGEAQALDYLCAAAEQSYMALVRYRAGVVLQEIGNGEASVSTLLKLATDSSIADPIRCDAMRALSFWCAGDEALAEQLVPVFEEENPMPTVREAAYAAVKSLLAA